MAHTRLAARVAATVMVLALGMVGCGGDDDATDAGSRDGGARDGGSRDGSTSRADAGTTPISGCPARLAPLSPVGTLRTVGDGTAASCTEATLRAAVDALAATAGGGSIDFDCGADPHTITVTSQLEVVGSLLIDGEHRITLSGGGTSRVLNLANHADVVVQRLVMSDGRTAESGGAIHHPWFGTLQAIDVVFQNNQATLDTGEIGGGAIFAGGLSEFVLSGCQFLGNSASNGGGVLNRGSTLSIVDCTFEGNAATSTGDGQFGNGGGLYIDGMDYEFVGDFHMCGSVFRANHANQHGSAVFSYFYEGSRSLIDQCLFENNEFAGSPTGGAGGLYHETVPLTLTNSTFIGNRSDKHAAGLFVGSTAGSSADISNCTFANNVVPEVGAAIFSGVSPVSVTNCTFSGNAGDYAPAIFNNDNATITVKNTIFANNTTPNTYSALACAATLADGGGGNFQWPATRNSGSDDTPCVAGITFADPLLEPPADHGGIGPTMALGAGSPAIDAASGCSDTDATGGARVGACDSGALERRP